MGSVGIGADVQLAGKRVALGDDGVADAFGAFPVLKLTVQLDALGLAERFLLELELSGQIQKADLFLFLGDDLVKESEVVAEEEDALGIVDRRLFAHVLLVEYRRHGRDVLVAEAKVGAG